MNILVVRTDKLGDFITALPTFYVLKRHNPQNRVVACVAPLNRALAESCDFIDEVIVNEGGSLWEFSRTIRRAKIDASVTLFSNTRVALAQFLAGIPLRIAPATKVAQIFYNRRIAQRRSEVKMAEFEYNLQLARALFDDIDLDFKKPLLAFDDREQIHRIFCANHDISRPIVAFHPGFGGSSDANWTLDEYIELVKTALQNPAVQVVMTFGPDEKELYEEAQMKLMGADVVFYLSLDGIIYFIKLLSTFKLFVSTSTGTYHLAAAVGTPTMTFFADTLFASVKRWKAISDEEIQHPYMLSADETKRKEQFEIVKKDLSGLISDL